jgi:hypothetical protein
MSLKADLSGRKRPSMPYSVQVTDPAEATTALQQAERMVRQAEIKDDKAELKRCRTAVTRAKKTLAACFKVFEIVALEPDEYEDLIDEHPPTPGQIEKAGKNPSEMPEWNDDTFYPALLAACVDDDMTAEDWAAFLKRQMSRGERRQLQYAVLAINENRRMPESMMLPKGWLGTGISNLR